MNIKHSGAHVSVLDDVADERYRQERLKAAGKFAHTCADVELSDDACCRVLGEEFGEVCRALNDGDLANLREELIQVAAVAVAWIERINRGDKTL
jgi:NTP pyrophosphatase (non-canonical NTP hydrolase)